MNNDLGHTMLRIFDSAAWRETFRRCEGTTPKFWKWLYEMYLLSIAWKIKRSQRRAIDGDQCQGFLCFCTEGLQVHHVTYERVGNENVETDLITLCRRCHKAEHGHKVETVLPAWEEQRS